MDPRHLMEWTREAARAWDPRTGAGPAPHASDGLTARQTILTRVDRKHAIQRVASYASEQLARTSNTGLPSRLYNIDPLSRFF